MRSATEGGESEKAVEFISIPTHNLKEEFSGQNYHTHDKVASVKSSAMYTTDFHSSSSDAKQASYRHF